MKLSSKAAFAALAAMALACGAASEPGDEALEEGAIGTIEQPYIYLDSATKQWGSQTGANRLACNKTSSSQVCSFARHKCIELARNPASFTTTENSVLAGLRLELDNEYPNWTFTLVDSAAAPAANCVRLLYQKGAVSGTLSSNIDGYRSVTFVSPVSLTEGQHPGLAAPVGNYQRHGSCIATIDATDVNNKGANAAEDERLMDHAMGSSAIVCMGVGMRDDAAGTLSQRPINVGVFLDGASNAEACRADIGDTADQNDISRQTASSCSGD
jgi:hypothetical protein